MPMRILPSLSDRCRRASMQSCTGSNPTATWSTLCWYFSGKYRGLIPHSRPATVGYTNPHYRAIALVKGVYNMQLPKVQGSEQTVALSAKIFAFVLPAIVTIVRAAPGIHYSVAGAMVLGNIISECILNRP